MKTWGILTWVCLLVLMGSLVTGCGDSGSPGGKGKVKQVAIGTGSATGVYYPAGGAIAELVNQKSDEYGVKVSVQSTGGSVFNINAVLSGDLEFGIAQSDRQFQAWHGEADWKDAGPQKDLRAVCSLHPEMVTLIAADDAGITSLADLKGKKVSIGNPGSGQRGNAEDVLKAAGIDIEKDIKAESLKASEQPSMLQDGRIDAFFFTVGHPNGAIKEATAGQRRKVRFVPITGMTELLMKATYYAPTTIPIRHYPKAMNKEDVRTIGMMTTVVTSSKVSDDVVYALTKELFENLETFKSKHPAFAELTKQSMCKGLTAPLHPGAKKYLVEVGLVK